MNPHRAAGPAACCRAFVCEHATYRNAPRQRYTPNVHLLRLHTSPPVPLTQGVAWPDTTAKIEFDFVVAGLPRESVPCRHATERSTAQGGLELWHIPKALVTYRSASIIVSVVCLECARDAEAERADSYERRETHD